MNHALVGKCARCRAVILVDTEHQVLSWRRTPWLIVQRHKSVVASVGLLLLAFGRAGGRGRGTGAIATWTWLLLATRRLGDTLPPFFWWSLPGAGCPGKVDAVALMNRALSTGWLAAVAYYVAGAMPKVSHILQGQAS